MDLTVERGEVLAVRGRSGSGKTTLLNILGGLDVPTTGELDFAVVGGDAALGLQAADQVGGDGGVRRDHPAAGILAGDQLGLGQGQAQDHGVRLLLCFRSLVHIGDPHLEGDAQGRIQLETRGQALPAVAGQLIGHSAQTRRCSA